MKKRLTKSFFLVVLAWAICLPDSIFAQTYYTLGDVTWNNNTNWSQNNSTPCFCSPAMVSNATVYIQTGHTATISNTSDIDANTTVDVQGTAVLTLNNTTNANAIATLTTSASSTINVNGISSNLNADNATINGTYNHNRNGGSIVGATWGATSTVNIIGVTNAAPIGLGQIFGNLTWNCAGQSGLITLTQNMTIKGNLTLTSANSQSLSFGTSTVNILGNMVHNIGASFDPGTSSFVFNSTNAVQTISGSPTFRDLTINNTHTTPTVTIPTSITVQNALTLTNGRLVASAGTDITFNGAVANLTRTNGWIVTNGTGKLVRGTGGANALFPIGSSTQYQPINIVTCAGSASVRFSTPTVAVPNSGVGSWFVNNGATNSNVVILNPQGTVSATSKVYRINAGVWASLPTAYSAPDYTAAAALIGSPVELSVANLSTTSFITTWQTTTASETITIPVPATTTYNCTVDWGDGLSNTYNTVSPVMSHVYAVAGTYTVSISGTFPRIFFNNVGDKTKIKTIEQWGNIAWTSMDGAFYGCNALQLNATDTPNLSTVGMSLSSMFRNCTAFTGNASMNNWNTSTVINMFSVFNGTAFNQPIGNWNTSAVTAMNAMFFNASVFNQNISNWNVGAVTSMQQMFQGATAFNQPIGTWNINSLNSLNSMFVNASSFNQPIGSWNTISVTDISIMFSGATAFNQNLSVWNTSNVTTMSAMFNNATAFNQSLATWQLRSAGVLMTNMLNNCGMNAANYDATLIGWAGQAGIPTGVILDATGRRYCTATSARNILTSTPKNWTITDGGSICAGFSAIAATNVTMNSFTANWTSVIGITDYQLEISTDGGSTFGAPVYTGIATSFTVTTVPANVVRHYRVKHTGGTVFSNIKAVSTILPAGSGNAITFDGTGGKRVDAGNNTVFSFANTFTLSAWIKINATGSQMDIISKRDATSTGYGLVVTAAGNLGVFRNNTLFTGNTLPTNTWTHVSVVFNASGGFTPYINGVVGTFVSNVAVATNILSLTIGSSPDGTSTFNGQIDEVHIWNTARNITQIQASMCSKLIGNESGLVGYFRLDENTGVAVENKAYLANADGILVSSPTWATSSAPIGDVSANTYGGTTVTLTNTDAMTANNITGAPAGVHLYKVNATPNAVGVPTGYASLYTDRYFGMFFAGGTSPQATLAYSYGANSAIDVANALRFAERTDNADNTWAKMGGVQNRLSRRLTHTETNAGEFILAERNAIINNYKDGGTILTFNNTGTGFVQTPRYVDGDFTIEFWMRPSALGLASADWEAGTGLVTANTAGTNKDFGVTLLDAKVAFGTPNATNSANTTITSTTLLVVNKWYHVAVTREQAAGKLILYINGKQEAATTSASTVPLTDALNIHIGKRLAGGGFFNGSIDELRIWNSVLSANTIKDWVNLRAQDQHPNFANLEAYYRFDENTGVLAEDLVNGNDASLTGGVVWADANMPLGDGAVTRMVVPATSNTISIFPEAGVTMNFGTTTPNGEVVVTRIDGAPESYPNVAGMSFMNCYWIVRNYGTNQTFSPLPEIKFEVPAGNTISATDLANPNNIKLYKRPEDAIGSTIGVGNWEGVAQATGFGSIRFTQSIGGSDPTTVDDFSQFVIGSGSSSLPITLLGLKGRRVEGQKGEMTEEVKLEWSTASEINNKGFEVEMSQEGRNYEKIAFTEGKGTSNTPINYQLTTINPKEGYYRLKQIDFDGTFSYSPIVFVEGMVGKDFVIVYPNPAHSNLKLKVSESILPTDLIKAEVYSMAGKRIWRGAGKIEELQASLQQAFPSWKAGTYILQIRTDKKRVETKFIKE